MKNYRNSILITADILDATQSAGRNGIQISNLILKSNLSHPRLSKFLENLIGNGLVNKIEYDGKNTFVITEKGIMYLQEYRKFHELAEGFGLEL